MYAWEFYIHERVRDHTCKEVQRTERENEVYVTFWSKDGVRCPEASEGWKVIAE